MFPTWRKPTVIGVGVLTLGVAAAAELLDVQIAAWLLSAGLVGAAGLRAFAPERDILTARGRTFDVTVLLLLAVLLALLAPWGLAQDP